MFYTGYATIDSTIIIIIVLSIIGFLTLIGIAIYSRKKFNDNLEQNIDNEIKNFLIKKNNPDYQFKNKSLELELRQRLKAEMIDLRSNGYRYKPSYKSKTLRKEKEIYQLINKYYNLDKKTN